MPMSPLTQTTGRTASAGRFFAALDLQAEADRLLTTARGADPRDGTSPWLGDQYAGYRIRGEAVEGVAAALRGGRTLAQAVDAGAEAGRRAVADYLTAVLNERTRVNGRPRPRSGSPGDPAPPESARVPFP